MNNPAIQPALARLDDRIKLDNLRRMQWFALALLMAMVLLLAIATAGAAAYPLPLLIWTRAFAEAAVIGAIADWFAVVALFRHPLSLPIPHTAIIPHNKDRIGQALGRFVEENFLTPENVIRRLASVNLAQVGAQWLATPANSERAASGVCAVVPRFLTMVEDEDVARFLTRTLLSELEKLNLSRVAGEVLEVVTSGDEYQMLLGDVLKGMERLIVANQPLILAKFGEASKYTPGFLDSYIVNRFVEGIIRLLHDVAADPQHAIRQQFAEGTRDLIEKLETSPEFFARGAAFKQQIIKHLETKPYYRALWNVTKQRILDDIASANPRLRQMIASLLLALGESLGRDRAMQQKLNGWLLGALESVMLTHRHQISLLITDVVKSWDAHDVSAKIELEIGKDLQFIRVNGTLVGGCVGIALHALTVLFA
jgi:uncharacterized membrane-anchored protein YjiN (DUF445 family)